MKRQKESRKAILTELVNAEPVFVSMVRRGANQRPFHAIKSQGGASTTDHKEMEMSDKTKLTKAAPDVVITRILFAKTEYQTEESVTEFLTAKGYSDFEIKDEGDYFAVDDDTESEIVGDTRELDSPTAKGVRYLVGDAKKSEGETAAGGDDAADAGADEEAAAAEDQEEAAQGETEQAQEDAGEDKPAEDAPAAEADPADEAETETKADAPRKRRRKAAIVVAGMTPAALAASYEAFGEHLDAAETSKKSFGESVLDYNGPTTPGVYSLNDAFMSELRRLVKAGRADETAINTLSGEFARAVVTMQTAYDSIINATIATKSEGDLDEIVDHLFGTDTKSLTSKTDDSAGPDLAAAIATIADEQVKLRELVQRSIDVTAVTLFEAEPIEGVEETRVIPERKSLSGVDENPNALDDEQEQDEIKENARRVAKRMGLML